MTDEQKTCVIALCNCGCGRIVYANAGELDGEARREIGNMVEEGYSIQRSTVGHVRTADWGCETRRKREEAEAAAAEAAKPENIERAKYEAAMAEMRAAKAEQP